MRILGFLLRFAVYVAAQMVVFRLLDGLGRFALRTASRFAFADPGEVPGPPTGPERRRRSDGTVILDAGLAAILGALVVLAVAAAGGVYMYATSGPAWSQ